MASTQELDHFLQAAQGRAFKRVLFAVRDEDAALDIVQESMIKLASHYADKPVEDLPFLFARIVRTTMLDWLRRRKSRWSWQINFSDLLPAGASETEAETTPLELLAALTQEASGPEDASSPEQVLQQQQTLQILEKAVSELPERQREAFLLRYWEEMSIEETAQIMGCSAGSVKTHCSRAIASLGQAAAVLALRHKPH